jgi:phosphate transport system permease protein
MVVPPSETPSESRRAVRFRPEKRLIRRVKRRDRIARWVITLGGVAIIASVIAIVVLIVGVTLPLFRGARAEVLVDAPLPKPLKANQVALVGVDLVEISKQAGGDVLTAYALARDGTFSFLEATDSSGKAAVDTTAGDPPEWHVIERLPATPAGSEPGAGLGRSVVAAKGSGASGCTLLWSDGSVSLVQVAVAAEFDERGRRSARPSVKTLDTFPAEQGPLPIQAVAVRSSEGSATCARLFPGNRISVVRHVTTEDLLGNRETSTSQLTIDKDSPGPIRTLTLNAAGTTVFGGTGDGALARWQFNDDLSGYQYEPFPAFRDERAITALAMVYGDVSLAVGDARGGLSTWSGVRYADSREKKLRLIHQLHGHERPVVDVVPSQRNMAVLSLGEEGSLDLDYVTSENHLLELSGGDARLTLAGFSPRGNAAVGLAGKKLLVWKIDNPHPEVSWRTLFGKVRYDNHDEAKYLWQSSGTHEPKFSLVPVVFGTLKATLYAMVFAVPLALCGAMYVSHFTTPGFKKAVKPVVEIMAAVPTVVVGFLVLLWLAPQFGHWIVAVFASFLTIPATFVAFMLLWQGVRRFDWAKRVENGYEFIVVALAVIAPGAVLAWLVANPLEAALFGGDFRQWLANALATPYEQLNSMVVAFGLGFAVIPIIFSMSEDALSSIPHELSAASLAVGASRWQTAWRVVLPSASPAIFAAVMIGFGRAVGETMIVFMAAGNTPILDWSPLNGFRTLSANIAVEISEAPKDGTLYRVLFLCAVLLFLLTFVLNTAAELVRQHLRKKFGQY